MVTSLRASVACLAVILMPAVASADSSAQSGSGPNVERGHAIANSICSTCHVIGAEQEFPPTLEVPGPDFRVLAKRSGVTAASLAAFLKTTHRTEGKSYTMPSPLLTDEMISQVVSYILSLRDEH